MKHLMDTRTPSALGIGLMAAAGYPVWPAPARQAPSPTAPAPEGLAPAEEIQELLRRVEALLVDARAGMMKSAAPVSS